MTKLHKVYLVIGIFAGIAVCAFFYFGIVNHPSLVSKHPIISEQRKGKEPASVATTPAAQPGQGAAPAPTKPPQEGTGKKLTPEEFYRLTLERQDIMLDFQKKRLALLKKYGSHTEEARQELMTIRKDTSQTLRAAVDKYGINYVDLRQATEDPAMQKANEEYLKAHSEIQEKIKQNREKQMELSKPMPPIGEKVQK
jgi:hypothetical protein